MAKIDAIQIYKQFKRGERDYNEEVHCPMVLEVMNDEGTAVAFCKKAMISESLFYMWLKKHKLLAACYAYGKILSRANWDAEGEAGKDEEFFNYDLWRLKGSMRYGVGKNRVRFGVDPKANPHKQYQQLVKLGNEQEFSASEIKQLMESINVGIRAFESYELQNKIDKMQEDVNQMGARCGNNPATIEKDTKTD